jgi:nonribosomal peptide synthetase protein BlmIV
MTATPRPAPGDALADRVARLDPARRAVLERALAARARGARERPDPLDAPASYGQERMWLLAELAGGAATYNYVAAIALDGPLRPRCLGLAIERVVADHEALRTVLHRAGGALRQRAGAPGRTPCRLVDLGGLPPAIAEHVQASLVSAETARRFDLARGPLLRCSVLRRDASRHVLVLAVHHAVMDRSSLGIMAEQLASHYRDARAGRPRTSAAPLVQYRDFAAWQRDRLEHGEREPLERFWQAALDGLEPAGVPPDFARPDGPPARAATVTRVVDGPAAAALRALARRERCSVFMLVTTATVALLRRLTGRTDVALATLAAGRTRREFERVIGYFVNPLVLRVRAGEDAGLGALLECVRAATVAANAHQELPFELALEQLGGRRDAGRPPVDVLCVAHPRTPGLDLPGIAAESLHVEAGGAQFDLVVETREAPGGMEIALTYDPDLYERATVACVAQGIAALLDELAHDPDPPAARVKLPGARPPAPRASRAPVAGEQPSIHGLFERRADVAGDRVALVDGERRVTFAALERRANRLARIVRASGVRHGDTVAVCLRRGPDAVAAMLAAMKAGAAVLPLDVSYPPERLASMLADAGAAALVTARDGAVVAAAYDGPVVDLDRDRERVGREPAGRLDLAAGALAPAYLLYTSASTGAPKGVLGTHLGAVNRLRWMWDAFPFAPGELCCHRTALTFVDAVWEIFGPLLAGVPAVVVDPDDAAEPAVLVERLAAAGVTRLVVVPSLLRAVLALDTDLDRRLARLRLWTASGERLPPALVEAFHDRLGGRTLLNLYGSAEVAADATAAVVGPGEARRARGVTIGHAITGMRAQVLDRDGHAQVPLAPGELYVSGPGLALGYHGRPGLTAGRFLPDPGAAEPGARRFRTGDVVRARAGGALEFLDRADDQVKIRGQRVELGEVEGALALAPDVAAAAVTARDEPHAGTVLVAYVVPAPGGFDRRAAHARLRRTLPAAAVPSAYVTLDRLPLSPSGKVDRDRLPAPGDGAWLGASAPVPPRTPTEQAVAGAFAEVLGRGRPPGVHDDFFLLGGHSLVAAEVVRQLRERFEVELGLRDVFEAPTVARLAALVDGRARTRAPATGLVAEPAAWHEPFALTEVQEAYWIGRDPDLPLGGVATHAYTELEVAALDPARLSTALARLVERHAMLRAVVLPDGTQRVLESVGPYEIAVTDLSAASPGAAAAHVEEVRDVLSHQVLPAGDWPLFDFRLTRLPGGRWRLHASIDALVCDAYSFGVLMRELAASYADPSWEPPPLEVTFRDVVRARERDRETPAYERSHDYWRARMPALPPGPELPASPARPDGPPRFVRFAGRLEPRAWRGLRERATNAGLTPSAVLLTAFAEVLAAWSRRPHFTLTLTVFDRPFTHRQIDLVVGDFTCLTLLEVDHRAPRDFAARARSLQERLWQDLDHRAVSAVTLLRERARELGGPPRLLAPVVFTSNLGVGREGTGAGPLLGEVVAGVTQTPQVVLDHQVATAGDALVFNWDALEARFPPGVLDEMFAAYQVLLHALADDARTWERSVRIPLPPGQADVRVRVNSTRQRFPGGLLQERVADVARRHGGREAVVTPSRRLAYAELVARSNRIGRRLRAAGARPGTLVGVALPKGWEQAVAVLGVLAAGAAYVPLDPSLPAARLSLLAEGTGVATVLTRSDLRGRLGGLERRRQLCVDDDREWAGESPERLPVVSSPRDLAYVVHTSGSTGTPKGVMIDHAGVLNTVEAVNRAYRVDHTDRLLAVSSLSFDLSVYDLFGAFLAGAAVVVGDPGRERDPAHWADLVRTERVSVWNSVPALMSLLVDHARPHGRAFLPSLRLVLLSGDWIPVELGERVAALTGGAEVVGLGGATEASIWSVWHPAGRREPGWPSVPYGRPMPNQRLYVLDGAMRPCPDWVAGELYIAGDGLARGYWDDDARTRERFVTHAGTGERLYRTGDVARYRPGGVLEFLGREDLQVKVNGYRVELAEVERALGGLDAVAACAVVVRGAPGGDRRLVAYVVPGDAEPGAAELRRALGEVLPAYMVPNSFVTLERLPLSANGKLDRAALERLDGASGPAAARPAATTAERARLERALCTLWEDVLGVPGVGPGDDFFQLGGTSLLAIRLVARLQERFGVKLPIVKLYEVPTVAALAGAIADGLAGAAAGPGAVPGEEFTLVAVPAAAHEPFALTDVQHAYWLGRRAGLDLGGVATHSYVELDVADLDVARLERALDRLVARHDALRIVVGRDGYQRVLPSVPPYRIELADLRDAPEAVAAATLAAERERMSHQVFAPEVWPLFEIKAHRTHDRWTRLHVGVDLLVADAHSLQILRREVLALYDDPDRALPRLDCTFRDYVLALERARSSAATLAARRYWDERVATLPGPAPLPLALDPRELDRPRFSQWRLELGPAEWGRLRALAAANALTPSGLLCAAFAEVLALWSQSRRFVINVTTFNRRPSRAAIDRVVGDFTSTTLLEADLSAATFAERARTLQAQLWRDLEHAAVSGIEVGRKLRRDPRRRDAAMMPIVFTSALAVGAPDGDEPPSWRARTVYAVNQTPQVLLDHQVSEHDGRLVATWDAVVDAFPAGLVPSMFDAYRRLLQGLAASTEGDANGR